MLKRVEVPGHQGNILDGEPDLTEDLVEGCEGPSEIHSHWYKLVPIKPLSVRNIGPRANPSAVHQSPGNGPCIGHFAAIESPPDASL